MLKTTESPDMPASKKNNDNSKVVGFSIDRSANRLNKKLKQKLSKSKNLRLIGTTEKCNFLTSDAKTNLKF